MADKGGGTCAPPISVLLVDDNLQLGKVLASRLKEEGFLWRGHLTRADFLKVHVEAECPDVNVVLLDLEMPGKDALAALPEFTVSCPSVRTIIFTAHCSKNMVNAAIRAGAWGYVCKLDGGDALLDGINAVMADKMYLSPQAREAHDG